MGSFPKTQSLAATTTWETGKKEQGKTEEEEEEREKNMKKTVHQTWFAEAVILEIRASCCFPVGTSVHAKLVKAFSIIAQFVKRKRKGGLRPEFSRKTFREKKNRKRKSR